MADRLPPPPDLHVDEIAVFLDFDGTVVEIEREPDAVHVPRRLRETLEDLQKASGGALALVSGRSLDQLDRLFSPITLNAAGLHGLERRNLATQVVRAKPDPAVFDRARQRLQEFADASPGVLLEDKGITLALHYRNAPDQEAAATTLARKIAAESNDRLTVLDGKMVVELRPPGLDKGEAIATFMREPPFAGRRPVFAGDDVTDEAGFATINDLGGISIRIGRDDRTTAARFALDDVTAMQAWLTDLLSIPA